MKIKNPAKLIAITCTVIAAGNFVLTLFPFLSDGSRTVNIYLYGVLHMVLPSVNLSLLDGRLFRYGHSDMQVDYMHLVFYLLMLLSGILFMVRGYKESRLLSFCLSIFLLAHILYVCSNLVGLVMYRKELHLLLWLLAYAITNALWSWFFWYMLKKIMQEQTLTTRAYETDGTVTHSYELASNWQRFFHLIMDRIVCLLVLSPVLYALIRPLHSIRFDRNAMGELLLIALISWCMFVYYLLFEGVLGSTPGKLLTGTQVCDENGNRPNFGSICIRTLSRLVPFEAFSCFGRGWHDQWSRTYVLRQVNKGVKGGYYFLLIPLLALLIFITNWGFHKYERHKVYVDRQEKYNAKIKGIADHWVHLSTNDFIQLNPVPSTYSSKVFYLKTEEIKQDSIVFSKLFLPYQYRKLQPIEAREAYLFEEAHERIAIHRKAVEGLLAKGYADYVEQKGASLLIGGSGYEIEDIYNLAGPEIRNVDRDRNPGYVNDGELRLFLENYGTAAEVLSIQADNPKQPWIMDTVFAAGVVRGGESKQPANVVLSSYSYKPGTPYKLQITLKSFNNGQVHHYIVEGKDSDKEIREVY